MKLENVSGTEKKAVLKASPWGEAVAKRLMRGDTSSTANKHPIHMNGVFVIFILPAHKAVPFFLGFVAQYLNAV